ncbi:hypothetical protein QTI33_16385 [Variovorax sp. J22P271]|uniref:hypothetical protein n=1 Tax=Variovorax davisae TaxID=3053515 RepID=UPI002575976D|nr:hypothetical protein [Variovorax sp. J22P271]MDM0033713.1 hypothetical protein [Variovorax sp. J22P271]
MKTLVAAAVGLTMAVSSTAFGQPRNAPPPRHDTSANDAAAALAAVAIGGVIAAAIAKDREQPQYAYPYPPPYGHGARPYPPPPPPTDNVSFSPAPGVMCYGAQRACFRGMMYAADWSAQVFRY